jgi:hypothetical protein
MILQTVRNECPRFCGHVGIQVSYKILRLEVLKDSSFGHLALFSIGADLRPFLTKNTSRTLGVNEFNNIRLRNTMPIPL